ncbi:MAG: hypothetical protein HY040_26420 [Planctomycetes bacterium]|nr:hypothetical protein [Planctomycetota bacterium]
MKISNLLSALFEDELNYLTEAGLVERRGQEGAYEYRLKPRVELPPAPDSN